MKIALITNYWKNSDVGSLALQGIDVSVLIRQGDDAEHFCGRYSQSEDINSHYNYIVSLSRF